MRVLMLHNRYKVKGGEDESALAEAALLRSSGHDVELLELNNDAIPASGNLRTAVDTVWSGDAYRTVKGHLARKQFDILHVQNFFPLWSPSVYYAASNYETAVVQSVRNYRLLCPAATLFREGRHCELCVGKKIPWPGVVHGCYHASRLASGAVGAMIATHWALGTWRSAVHQYIALTRYVRDQLIAGGLRESRISVKPNFIVDPRSEASHPQQGDYFIYVGRLLKEKGLDVLLAAWSLRKPNARLKLVGGGAIPPGTSVPAGVDLAGELPIEETYRLIAGAKALILPAQWAEPFGRVVIEAFALGTPVICSAAGALPELVEDGVTGVLVEPGNAQALAAAIDRVEADGALRARLRENARRAYVTSYSEPVNYESLIAIYERAIDVAAVKRAKTHDPAIERHKTRQLWGYRSAHEDARETYGEEGAPPGALPSTLPVSGQ
jgi:glycosyltransferase involved in cell wall biosynthesis